MPGIFASQFSYGDPYTPEGLQPGVLNVGANLPSTTTKEKTPTEEPASKPAPISNPSLNAANQAVGQSAQNAAARQGAISKAMHLGQEVHVAQPQHLNPSLNPGVYLDKPVTSVPKEVQTPKPSTVPRPGLWSQVGHDIASGFDATRHGIAAGADKFNAMAQNPDSNLNKVMHFGDPFAGTPMERSGGVLGIVNAPKQAPAPVEGNIIPRTPTPELPQAAPRVIPGQVVEPNSVGAGAAQSSLPRAFTPRALPRAYTSQEDFMNMLRASGMDTNINPNVSPAQFGSVAEQAASSPSTWDEIVSGLGSLGSDILSGVG